MSRLFVLRHGPTDWNAHGLIQGRADPPLSDDGRKTVERWRLPPEWARARWLASPLDRAMETARLMGAEPRPEPRLAELDWGAWEGRSLADLRADPEARMPEREAQGLDFQPPGGESYRMVQKRLLPLLQDCATDEAMSVWVCHKGVMLALYALATGWTMIGSPPEKLRDGCGHAYRLDAAGKPQIDRLNQPLAR